MVKADIIRDLDWNKEHFYLGKFYDLPKLEFYDNPAFEGTPVMVLKEDGLYFKTKKICNRAKILRTDDQGSFRFRDANFYEKGHANYIPYLNHLDNCKDSPIKRVDINNGKHDNTEYAYDYYIELQSRKDSDLVVKYKKNDFYLKLDLNKLGSWTKTIKSVLETQGTEIRKRLDAPAQKLLAEFRSCLDKKDIQCIKNHLPNAPVNQPEQLGDERILLWSGETIRSLTLKGCEKPGIRNNETFAKCILNNPSLFDSLKACVSRTKFPEIIVEVGVFNLKGKEVNCYYEPFEGILKFFYSGELLVAPNID